MLGLSEATRIAKGLKSGINHYAEEPDAFIFTGPQDNSDGGDGPCVVMKDTGECLNMLAYIVGYHSHDIVSEGAVS